MKPSTSSSVCMVLELAEGSAQAHITDLTTFAQLVCQTSPPSRVKPGLRTPRDAPSHSEHAKSLSDGAE